MSIILKAEKISKQYRLGNVGTGTLGDDLKRWWYGMRGKEDPFLKVGAINDRSSNAKEDYVWALRDVNFEVKQGEVLGIIGKNGAGKSTLLKLLSRVTAPTMGTIKTKGRIASLLEIGTGFHPELTGRENIFMNGAVLGMTKAEIKEKLDEIIWFSGCQKYIDTPVKRYSSGMKVRLGFAVAAHLEPEILVVDEVLAVGDADFQKKAIGKMKDLSSGEGRTVLFVSHNMASVKSLCTKALVLKNGRVSFKGNVREAINDYLCEAERQDVIISEIENRTGHGYLEIVDLSITQGDQIVDLKSIMCGENYLFTFKVKNFSSEDLSFHLGLSFYTSNGQLLSATGSEFNREPFKINAYSTKTVSNSYSKFPLTEGKYLMNLSCSSREFGLEDFIKDSIFIEVSHGSFYSKRSSNFPKESVLIENKWSDNEK